MKAEKITFGLLGVNLLKAEAKSYAGQTIEHMFKLVGFLLEHGVVYAYLGFWGVVALFDISNRQL